VGDGQALVEEVGGEPFEAREAPEQTLEELDLVLAVHSLDPEARHGVHFADRAQGLFGAGGHRDSCLRRGRRLAHGQAGAPRV
jgi:hypothetical protein